MTERLYTLDSYTRHFEARVLERVQVGKYWGLVLDRTCFYPSSGGQPNDRGRLNQAEVIDVLERPEDGAIVHVVSGRMPEERVIGEIDWARRFDHMQQHSGQHILSRAFVEVADAQTVGFHLSPERVTIDLNRSDLNAGQIEQAETLANEIVFSNRSVAATIRADARPTGRFADRLAARQANLRLVEIEDFDLQPCGGTHVARTGEVGLIKVLRADRQAQELRIEFRCGGRALSDYRLKNQVLTQVSSNLSVGPLDLEAAIQRLQAELKQLRHEHRAAAEQLQVYEATELMASTEPVASFRVIHRAMMRPPVEVRSLAKRLIEQPGLVVLFGIPGERSQLVFARSKDVDRDMVALLRGAVQALGGAGGGGQPDFAQGGVPDADEARVDAALNWALTSLREQG